MAANEYVGEMNDAKMIDTLLNTVLKNTPQRPKWVDGSGLSRYNLFTPKDMVFILENLTANFGFARMQNILPTANEGTLTGLYKGYENRIFAKTGSLNNNTALSGYLLTKQNKRLIFSIMINNYRADAGVVKKEIERFLVPCSSLRSNGTLIISVVIPRPHRKAFLRRAATPTPA